VVITVFRRIAYELPALMPPAHTVCDLVEQLGHGELSSFGPEGMDKDGADAGPVCKVNELERKF